MAHLFFLSLGKTEKQLIVALLRPLVLKTQYSFLKIIKSSITLDETLPIFGKIY